MEAPRNEKFSEKNKFILDIWKYGNVFVQVYMENRYENAKTKGLASYCKAETTFTFYFTILPLSRAFLSINNREMKSESGFSFAMASQPFKHCYIF